MAQKQPTQNKTVATAALQLLKQHGMSVTPTRLRVLELFMHKGSALAHAQIDTAMGQADRVTIYRTLQAFVDKGLLHTVPTTDNSIQYALCQDDCGAGHHHDNHVHFACDRCHTTFCLNHVVQPTVQLPSGFSIQRTELLVTGKCKDCTALSA